MTTLTRARAAPAQYASTSSLEHSAPLVDLGPVPTPFPREALLEARGERPVASGLVCPGEENPFVSEEERQLEAASEEREAEERRTKPFLAIPPELVRGESTMGSVSNESIYQLLSILESFGMPCRRL